MPGRTASPAVAKMGLSLAYHGPRFVIVAPSAATTIAASAPMRKGSQPVPLPASVPLKLLASGGDHAEQVSKVLEEDLHVRHRP